MKTLLIRERMIALGAKFDVTDRDKNLVYFVEADKFDFGKNIHVYSPNKDIEYYYFEQKIRIGAHKYKLYEGKSEIATINKEFMSPSYSFSCHLGNFEMVGANMFGRRYKIMRDGILVGEFEKPITFFTDYYELKVFDESLSALIVGLAILIDMVRFHDN